MALLNGVTPLSDSQDGSLSARGHNFRTREAMGETHELLNVHRILATDRHLAESILNDLLSGERIRRWDIDLREEQV
jgi:hypothetical protein